LVNASTQPPPKAPAWKRLFKLALLILLVLVLSFAAIVGALVLKYKAIVGAKPGALQTKVQPREFGRWVNPFIATGGFPWVCGHNFPGAMVPLGMVRLGPETESFLLHKRALNTSGYFYGDDRMLGFSHTRLNGTGATDGGAVLVVPSIGPVVPQALRTGHCIRFSHSDEVASPGYYAVKLAEPGVLVELTATPRVGVHRYTFTKDKAPHLILDVTHALGNHRTSDGEVRVLPDAGEVEGAVRLFGTFASRYGGLKTYFVARYDQPLAAFATWQGDRLSLAQTNARGNQVGVDLTFAPTNRQHVVTLKVAISYVSIQNARANLEAEADIKDFDAVVARAQQIWEERLSLVKVQGGTDKQKTIFYTALYRAFEMPTLFNDACREYVGFDGKVHQTDGFQYFTDLSLWDTFRTVHPLYTLIAPKEQRDMLNSLVKMLEQGGWLPRWPSGRGYSNSMLGTPADIVIADSYLKGIRGFDVERAYQAMRQTALAPNWRGAAFSGRQGIQQYLKYKYCPSGPVRESVARTLEFGWADHAISLLAEALGHHADAELFLDHSRYYRNLWNPATQYFQPRDPEGRFVEPFKPLLLTYFDRKGTYTKDYVEGSALQWRWGAPYDAPGLIALFKSRDYFVDELNSFFARSDPAMGAWSPGPYYWQGNQPDIHAAWLFNEAGRPDLTQKWVRWLLDHKYDDNYVGLDGNDDAGTISAWYLFGALGLYPVPGSDKYELGAPLFERAELKLKDKPLVIVAQNYAPNRCYAGKVWLNDQPLDRSWITHGEIAQGGTLRFSMAAEPAKP
jgi:predicted alpha-1,2-mannosidase